MFTAIGLALGGFAWWNRTHLQDFLTKLVETNDQFKRQEDCRRELNAAYYNPSRTGGKWDEDLDYLLKETE